MIYQENKIHTADYDTKQNTDYEIPQRHAKHDANDCDVFKSGGVYL